MTRYGPQFGPDFTFLGVPECDLDDESSYADADVVIWEHRSMGVRPIAPVPASRRPSGWGITCRMTGHGPRWRCGPTGLQDLKVYDAGDVEMCSGGHRGGSPSPRGCG